MPLSVFHVSFDLVTTRPGRCHRSRSVGAMAVAPPTIDLARDTGRRGPADRGAHRRRHLHRQRHPRLPGSERGVDQEPGGREDGHAAELRGRPRRAARPRGRTGCTRRPGRRNPTRVTTLWPRSAAPAGCRRSSPRTSTGCTSGRHGPRPDRRDPRDHARGGLPGLRRAGADASGPSPGSQAGEEDPACRSCGGHPQVGHHQLRPVPGDGRPGAGPTRWPAAATCCWPSARPWRCTPSPTWCRWPAATAPRSSSSTASPPRWTTSPTSWCSASIAEVLPAARRRPDELTADGISALGPIVDLSARVSIRATASARAGASPT